MSQGEVRPQAFYEAYTSDKTKALLNEVLPSVGIMTKVRDSNHVLLVVNNLQASPYILT